MSFRDILLHVDETGACDARIDVAAELARSSDAHLTGLYVYPRLELPATYSAELPPEFLQTLDAEAERKASETQTRFADRTGSPDLRAEWRAVRGNCAEHLITQARYSDLVVLGQPSPDEYSPYAGVPDEVIISAGRPVLMVPYTGARTGVGRRVVVAWNASREAARAVNDAMPILESADSVVVVVMDINRHEAEHAALPGADVCLHLARHGVDAEAQHLQARDIDVANLLLSRIADLDADLLVMGAYGHSRLREIMLGGATRDVLAQMTVSVMMSH